MGQYSKKTDHRSVYDDNMKKRIVQKENAILNLQNQILEKRRAMIKLKKDQETHRNKHFAKTRLTNWKKMYNIVKLPDESLRPPDKTFNVRVYSNMDRDMWDGGARGETLRGWFQKNAAQREMEHWSPQKTGYVVPNTSYQPKPDVMKVDHYKSRILNRSPYSVPKEPAGKYFSLPDDGSNKIF
ncbi:hypothetical protein TrCOL_g6019 [Triparma columacea]|uniref:Uncharacterized protein n=1 Tax=Triparma columacea TaxID=722753 RepID=A0A9W7G5V1_9STRA|nr:hypothetical protein TrCOL_g6019 [Triparma columacea]